MDADKVPLRLVTLWLCDLCLSGAGGECHAPGCALWMNRAPDMPILLPEIGTGHDTSLRNPR